jgi:hypothetical protein
MYYRMYKCVLQVYILVLQVYIQVIQVQMHIRIISFFCAVIYAAYGGAHFRKKTVVKLSGFWSKWAVVHQSAVSTKPFLFCVDLLLRLYYMYLETYVLFFFTGLMVYTRESATFRFVSLLVMSNCSLAASLRNTGVICRALFHLHMVDADNPNTRWT